MRVGGVHKGKGQVGKRWQRLFSMSPDEVWLRSRQLFAARADALRYRMGNSFAVGIRPTGAPSPSFYFRDDEVGRICDLLKRRLPEKAEEILSRAPSNSSTSAGESASGITSAGSTDPALIAPARLVTTATPWPG